MTESRFGKILHLTYGCCVGGCELHLLQLCRGLAARGWEVHLAYFREVISNTRSLVREFDDAGVRRHDLGDVPWWHPAGWRALSALLRQEQFHIVHSHLPGPDIVGGIVTWWTGLDHKRIVSVHNQRHRAGIDYPRWAMRRSWSTADGIVVISEAVRDHLDSRLGIDPRSTTVIRYGLPDEPRRADPFLRRELRLSTQPLLVNVGRLVPQKGQAYLIDAMPEILRRVPDCHLAIIGHPEGSYAATLERHVRERGLERHVHVMGYRDVGAAALAEADAFVFPSLWEGFGLAVIEAMQAGVPVVCSDVGPLREIVVDGQSGLRVPARDSRRLAHAVLNVLESRELAARLADEGRRRVREMFGVRRMVDETHQYYLATIDGAERWDVGVSDDLRADSEPPGGELRAIRPT